jgi:putative FmdB family regulatory protein
MPMFEYRCGSCGREFEELVLSPSAEKGVRCPDCGAAGVQKKMSCFTGMVGASTSGEAVPAPPSCGYS